MGRGVDIPSVGGQIPLIGGRYIMGKGVNISWVGVRYFKGMGVKIPW
jgi:hypothetical protein